MKQLLEQQLRTFGEEVAKDLDITIPTIEYVDEAVFHAFTMFRYRHNVMFIESIEPAFKIQICLPNIEEACNEFDVEYREPFIKRLIAHELRHVWQSIYKQEVLIEQLSLPLGAAIYGHGNMPAEKDANQYAMMWAETEYEKLVFELATLLQQLVAINQDQWDVLKALRLAKKIRKYNKKSLVSKLIKFVRRDA